MKTNKNEPAIEKDESFGIIPLRKRAAKWHVFIIKQKAGHLGFPKGHRNNPHESCKEAAERELKEETGFRVKYYYPIGPFTVNYECISHGKHVDKCVVYFVADVSGNVQLCPHEIEDGWWMTLEQARRLVPFDNIKLIIDKIQEVAGYGI